MIHPTEIAADEAVIAKKWAAIGRIATRHAGERGHNLGKFNRNAKTPNVRMASCETCHGCCWTAVDHAGKTSCGGRLLNFQCGTKEAMGVL